MGVNPTLSDGVTTVSIRVEKVTENVSARIATFDIPNSSITLIQKLGRRSDSIPLSGFVDTAANDAKLKSWAQANTTLTYIDTRNPSGISVIMMNYTSDEIAGKPANYFEFSSEILEI